MNPPTYEELFADMVEDREITIEFLRLVNESATTEHLLDQAAAFFARRSGYRTVRILPPEDAPDPRAQAEGSALIPLTVGTESLGWLQLGEPRAGLCSPARLALCERLAGQLAVSLARARAEESLRASEATLRGILNASKESVWFFDLDGRIRLANQTALDRLQRSSADVLGRDFAEFVPADIAALRWRQLRKVVESGQPAEHEDSRNGMDFLHRFYPVFDPAGHVTHVATFSQDVTRRKQVEDELRRYGLVVQQSRDIILFMRGEDGRLLEANPAATVAYGYTRDELLSLSVHDLHALESIPLDPAQLEQAEVRGLLFETIHRRKDGSTFPVEVSSRGATVAGVRTIVSVVRDISERRRAEAREGEQRRQLEHQLAELDAIFDSLAEPLLVSQSGGELVRANPAFQRLFGTATDWTGADPAERVRRVHLRSADGRPVDPQQTPGARALAGETVHGVLQQLPRPDGTVLHLSTSAAPIRTGEGVVGAVVVFTDVTERVRTEEALRESQAALQAFYDSSPIMMGICELDGDAIVADYGNAAVASFFGRSPKGLAGRSGAAPGTPDDVDRMWLEHYRRSQQERVPVRFEYQHPTSNGPAWLSVTVSFVGKASSGRPRFSFVAEDISERKRSQQRVATLARLYEVLSRANEAIVRTRDEQSLYQQICLTVAEVGGFPLVWIGLVHGRAVAPVASAGPASSYVENLRVDLDGELGRGPTGTAIREGHAVVNHDFETNPMATPWRSAALAHGIRASAAFPLRNDGNVVGAVTLYASTIGAFDEEHVRLLEALCADVSYALGALAQERLRTQAERALRESEQNLREVDQRKNEFLAVLSHELRNPLAPIVNSLYILDHVPPTGEQAIRARAIIGRQVAQLSNLVNDLLDVTRITRNKAQLQKERVELNDIVRRAVDDHRSLFERAGIALDLAPSPRPVFLLGDRTRIAQVVGNLLHNAAKFTSKGGSAQVSVATDGSDAVLRVSDDGAGMDSETLDRLFQPFIQADKTLDRSKGGLGLGLALVKGLVELHGGSVAAHSGGLGKGSELVVRLPLDRGAALDHDVKVPPIARARRRILIIEDNVDAAESLQEALLLDEHDVSVAPDGPTGIARARAFRPDVILCDIGLPGMDGFAVARALRADPLFERTFLVALSGYALPEDLQRAAEAGFDRHLAKPPRLEILERLLAET